MAQTGYTPVSLYYSTTTTNTPTAGNLANGELAINITDGKLFYKDNTGTVQTLATKASASTTISFGSTGLTSFTSGGAVYASSTSALTTGTLPATSGGTAQSTYTTGDILYASASNTLSKLSIGSSGQVLTISAGVPTWAAASGGISTGKSIAMAMIFGF